MDLKACLRKLEDAGKLVHVKTEVDPVHELAGVCAKLEGKEVVQFDKVKGSDMPIVSGMWWNRDNLACIFDTTGDKLPFLFNDAVKNLHSNPQAPIVVENATGQEVIMDDVDLSKIPVPTLALLDGGPYFSNCIVIAKDPDTGVRNTSIHRFMISGKNRMGILMDVGRHLRDYYERAEARNEPLEISINNGVHPAYYVAATTPSSAAPIDVDELAVASYLLGEAASLCKSKTIEPEGIAQAQIIIEGEILPHVREPEGPFGEVSGYYATREDRWVVNVKAITMQKDPILHMLHPGREVWNSVGLTAEAGILQRLNQQLPGVKNVYLSHGGSHYHAIVQMDPKQNGMAKNAIAATFAAFAPLQMVTVVNSDVDIFDSEDVERAKVTRCDPAKDIVIIPGAFGHELNPIVVDGMAAKIGFDCTCTLPRNPKYTKVSFQEVSLDN